VRIRRPGRDSEPDRLGPRRPAFLRRQAQEASPAQTETSYGYPGTARTGHDKKAEWIWGVLDELEAAHLVTWPTKSYREAVA
jgi:hypothetical protein